jgi:hypothetical protein
MNFRIEVNGAGPRRGKRVSVRGTEEDWAVQSLPDGPMTVGIDRGFVRARHKAGFFKVIARKSIVAFRRAEEQDILSAKRFGFVQIYDTKPRRRLWELLKAQGM